MPVIFIIHIHIHFTVQTTAQQADIVAREYMGGEYILCGSPTIIYRCGC